MAKIITQVEQGSETYKIKDTVYGLATTSLAGLMSASDKSKLDTIGYNATVSTTGTMTANHVVTSNGGNVIKDSGYTIAKSVPSNAKFTDTNTTYTFSGGTNKFTVTPSGGGCSSNRYNYSVNN